MCNLRNSTLPRDIVPGNTLSAFFQQDLRDLTPDPCLSSAFIIKCHCPGNVIPKEASVDVEVKQIAPVHSPICPVQPVRILPDKPIGMGPFHHTIPVRRIPEMRYSLRLVSLYRCQGADSRYKNHSAAADPYTEDLPVSHIITCQGTFSQQSDVRYILAYEFPSLYQIFLFCSCLSRKLFLSGKHGLPLGITKELRMFHFTQFIKI